MTRTMTPQTTEELVPDPRVFIAAVDPDKLSPSGHVVFTGDAEGLAVWVMLEAKDKHSDLCEVVGASAQDVAADLLSITHLADRWTDCDLMTLIELRDGGGMLSAELVHAHADLNREWYEKAARYADVAH